MHNNAQDLECRVCVAQNKYVITKMHPITSKKKHASMTPQRIIICFKVFPFFCFIRYGLIKMVASWLGLKASKLFLLFCSYYHHYPLANVTLTFNTFTCTRPLFRSSQISHKPQKNQFLTFLFYTSLQVYHVL